MAARLKVFGWSDGFHSWTVATTSRPKALAAWEVEQDLFKSGLANEVDEGPEHEAALASPGTVIKTAMAIDPGIIEALKPTPGQARRRKARAEAEAIRTEISVLEAGFAQRIEELRAERTLLDERIADLETEVAAKRAVLEKSLKAARS